MNKIVCICMYNSHFRCFSLYCVFNPDGLCKLSLELLPLPAEHDPPVVHSVPPGPRYQAAQAVLS